MKHYAENAVDHVPQLLDQVDSGSVQYAFHSCEPKGFSIVDQIGLQRTTGATPTQPRRTMTLFTVL